MTMNTVQGETLWISAPSFWGCLRVIDRGLINSDAEAAKQSQSFNMMRQKIGISAPYVEL